MLSTSVLDRAQPWLMQILFVSETQEYIFRDITHYVREITLHTWNFKSQKLSPKTFLTLIRPNHPNNCHILDFNKLENIDIKKIKQLRISFRNGTGVKIIIEDKKAMVKRSLKFNKFGTSGLDIALSDTSKMVYKYYAVKFEQKVFVEEDPSVVCAEYPTERYQSFEECDSEYLKKMLQKSFSTNFTPIWAVDGTDSVTQWIYLDTEKYKTEMIAYNGLITGISVSDCPLPCTSTQIKIVSLDEKYGVRKVSRIDIAFEKTVLVSKTDFPKFNIIHFLAEFGGSMGLWLGLGVVQTMELPMKMGFCKKIFS